MSAIPEQDMARRDVAVMVAKGIPPKVICRNSPLNRTDVYAAARWFPVFASLQKEKPHLSMGLTIDERGANPNHQGNDTTGGATPSAEATQEGA